MAAAPMRRQLSSSNLDDMYIVRGLEVANCRITGTSMVKRKGFLAKHSIVYHVKVINGSHVYVVDCVYEDFARFYKELRTAPKAAVAFLQAIAGFPCPKKSLFGHRDALVIKGMCGQLENHLTNVLRLCRIHGAALPELKEHINACILEFVTHRDPIHAPLGRCHPVLSPHTEADSVRRCLSSTVM
ncbi:hypothetical protein SDRG_12066 [Saprolegnia diclina VS20]|uniref:PX domain-containing protein n=1 Tax=Saprolegnia diclina (strain VS20) TaxID=1156394 RepID=T0Q9Q6_SAPDV|nr:hypothetical protein SDRG_12066 [Saprolegnia diclina VS20]EQC30215.1 hypothetical protein SDRG_12066 [Saprolegnia diclina VS20]|eukprot:XP_008616347.1 hypothetical protein SDRG_12066 [Saprolegnia diclina VS20]